MKKKTIIAALCVVALLATMAFALVACKRVPSYVDATKLEVRMFDDYTIATGTYDSAGAVIDSFDLTKAFPDSTYAIKGSTDVATLAGNALTLKRTGKFKLTVTKGEDAVDKNITVIDGINVFSSAQLNTAVEDANKNAVVHNEITFNRQENVTEAEEGQGAEGTVNFPSNTGVYGNGNYFNAENLSAPRDIGSKGWGTSVLVTQGENVVFQDFQIVGKDMREMTIEDMQAFDISLLERYGTLISIEANKGETKSAIMKNVVAENGHKVICITGVTATLEGCIIKNAADSLLSIGAYDNNGTKLTLKNNVLMSAVVGAIVFYGWVKTNNFADVTIEGFLDIYNWKESETAKIMPTTEEHHGLANSLVTGELKASKNQKYIYYKDDLLYVHTAIVIISTDKLLSNKVKINGVVIDDTVHPSNSTPLAGTDNYVIRKFPLPGIASIVLKTSCLIGYGNNSETPDSVAVKPETKLQDNIYGEMRNGRK